MIPSALGLCHARKLATSGPGPLGPSAPVDAGCRT